MLLTSLKSRLILRLARHLLPIVDVGHVISFTKQGELLIGGELATPPQINNLKEEIKMLETFEVWRLINNYPNDIALRRTVNEAKEWTDVLVGKIILYTLDIQKQIIERIKDLSTDGKPNNNYRDRAVKAMGETKERLISIAKEGNM